MNEFVRIDPELNESVAAAEKAFELALRTAEQRARAIGRNLVLEASAEGLPFRVEDLLEEEQKHR